MKEEKTAVKDIQWKLISELLKNSHKSDREIAKELKVSQPTVNRQRKRLEKESYIREYTIMPDFAKLGYEIMAITFLKLSKLLSAKDVEQARDVARESLKTGEFEVIMLERGMGMGYDGVAISLHENYNSYLEFKNRFKQFTFLELSSLDSFIISLNDETRYRPLTFSTLAKHLLELKEEEKKRYSI